ncbi:hypothetical protein [Gibbsiella dentisursi]|uniref:hypothetical protein n=1 Tax=Gibbsiella dentisursi TaxID=796890 RepID=UPI0031F885A7
MSAPLPCCSIIRATSPIEISKKITKRASYIVVPVSLRVHREPKASHQKSRRFYQLPTEAGVNTNQSGQSAQGQFAAASAFAEKNAKKVSLAAWPTAAG